MKLKPFRAKPVVIESCACCKVFVPECLVPVGESAVPMCWACAHHVTEHETPMHETYGAECECMPHEIYPHDVLVAGLAS